MLVHTYVYGVFLRVLLRVAVYNESALRGKVHGVLPVFVVRYRIAGEAFQCNHAPVSCRERSNDFLLVHAVWQRVEVVHSFVYLVDVKNVVLGIEFSMVDTVFLAVFSG